MVSIEEEHAIRPDDRTVFAFMQCLLIDAEYQPYLKQVGLSQRLKHALLPFLKCTALFFHAVTMVTPPEALKGHFHL